MIDSVLSIYHNPMTCGVSNFDAQLAKRLGVPLRQWGARPCAEPLISVKSEHFQTHGDGDDGIYNVVAFYERYHLFLHDEPHWLCSHDQIRRAVSVFCANPTIARHIRDIRPDAVTTWCPSLLQGNADRGGYRVLTFGFSHKREAAYFGALRAQLDQEHGDDYTVSLSVSVHGHDGWPAALSKSEREMREIFGDKLRVLGFLADDALARELEECDAVAAYFDPALRANNTSAWAALAAGKKLYTNTDADSPPLDASLHTWEALIDTIKAPVLA